MAVRFLEKNMVGKSPLDRPVLCWVNGAVWTWLHILPLILRYGNFFHILHMN